MLFLASAVSASAATYTWTGAAGDGAFANPANWNGGVAPAEDGTATVVFTDAGAGTVQLPGNANLSQIQFQNTAATQYKFVSSGVSVLTLQNGVTASGGGSDTFTSSVTIKVSTYQHMAIASGTVEFDGTLIGSGSLEKTGAGNLRIAGLNTLTGSLTDNAGTITFSNLGGLGFGPIHLGGGQVNIVGNAPVLISNPVSFDADTTFTSSSGQAVVFSGPVILTKSVKLTATDTSAVFYTGNIN
jgi:autotransporter-associated beta strand protein